MFVNILEIVKSFISNHFKKTGPYIASGRKRKSCLMPIVSDVKRDNFCMLLCIFQ